MRNPIDDLTQKTANDSAPDRRHLPVVYGSRACITCTDVDFKHLDVRDIPSPRSQILWEAANSNPHERLSLGAVVELWLASAEGIKRYIIDRNGSTIGF
jgi:hypothetical protein